MKWRSKVRYKVSTPNCSLKCSSCVNVPLQKKITIYKLSMTCLLKNTLRYSCTNTSTFSQYSRHDGNSAALWLYEGGEKGGGGGEEGGGGGGVKGDSPHGLSAHWWACRRRCQITAQPVLTNYQLRKVWGPCVFSKHRCRTTVRGNHQPQWKVGGKMFGHINIVMLCFN